MVQREIRNQLCQEESGRWYLDWIKFEEKTGITPGAERRFFGQKTQMKKVWQSEEAACLGNSRELGAQVV